LLLPELAMMIVIRLAQRYARAPCPMLIIGNQGGRFVALQ